MTTDAPSSLPTTSIERLARVSEGLYLGGLHFHYLKVCRRKAWLKLRGFEADRSAQENIGIGHALNRPFADEEERLPGGRLDAVHGRTVIERKKSGVHLNAALAQLRYYLWLKSPTAEGGWRGVVMNYDGETLAEIEWGEAELRILAGDILELEALSSSQSPPLHESAKLCASCGFNTLCLA